MAERISKSPDETRALAAQWAATLQPGTVVALDGPLGAGKTCFVQGLAQGLGVAPDVIVNSPTYVLLNIYPGRCPVYHFDWYRVDRIEALAGLDLEEYLEGQGVSVIEWAEKFPSLLPPHTHYIRLETLSPSRRRLVMG